MSAENSDTLKSILGEKPYNKVVKANPKLKDEKFKTIEGFKNTLVVSWI